MAAPAADLPHLLLTIANVLVRAGSLAEARVTYEQALARRPTDSLILTNYAAFLQTQGDVGAAAAIRDRIPPP